MYLTRMTVFVAFVAIVSTSQALQQKDNFLSDKENIRRAIESVIRNPNPVVGELLEELKRDLNISDDKTGCKCISHNCGCCVHVSLKELHINDDACVNVSYLPHDIGFRATMTIGRIVVFNSTVSVRNPPPICFGIPHFHKLGSVCIDFHDLDVTGKQFSGCVRIEFHLIHVIKKGFELGCFRIPLKSEADANKLYAVVKDLNYSRNATVSLPRK